MNNIDLNGPPPPEGDPNVGMWVYHSFQIARKEQERLKWREKWARNHELVRGRHFRKQKSKYPLVPVNLFHVAYITTVANLTDANPQFDIIPHDEEAKAIQPIMQKAASTWWQRTGQQKVLSDSEKVKEKYGSTIEKISFDPALESGKGEISSYVVDCFKFLPWPKIRDIQKMPRLFEYDNMALEEIRRVWPETGPLVKPDSGPESLSGKEREEIRAGSFYSGRHSDNLPSKWTEGRGVVHTEYKIDEAMVIECWCKDYTMVPETVIQPVTVMDGTGNALPVMENGQPVMQEVETGNMVPKYPGFIRVIHIANDGKVVLDDVPNPSVNPNMDPAMAAETYLWDKYPYVKADSYSDENNFWGYSIVEQIEILVLEINKKVSQIAAYIDKTVRPTLINPKNSGIESNKISNLPGQQLRPVNHVVSQYIRYLTIPNLPTDFYKYIELLLKLVDIITGIHDVTEGRKPAGVSAASAIMTLQEKAETIFRDKIRNQGLLLQEKGRMWISLAQNWYTEPRKLSMAGKDVAGYPEEFATYRGSDFTGEFSFEVVPGSTMPKSQFARREQAIQLFQSGGIDQRALLESFDWPNIEEVINRMIQGPLGQLLERLQGTGQFPEETLKVIQMIGSMSENDYKQMFQKMPPQYGGTQLSPTQAGK